MAKRASKDVLLLSSMGVILNKDDRAVSHELKRSSEVLIRVSGQQPRSLITKPNPSPPPLLCLFLASVSKSFPQTENSSQVLSQTAFDVPGTALRDLDFRFAVYTSFHRVATLTPSGTVSVLNTSRNSSVIPELIQTKIN